MINNLKNTVIIVLGVLLASVSCWALYQKSQKEKAENKTSVNQKVVNQAATIINRYIDSSGRKHAVLSADSNHLPANWYQNGTAIKGGLVDTVAQALNIAKKQLEAITQVATITQAEKLSAQKQIDSLRHLTYYYQDKYLWIAYHPAKADDTTGNGQFDFKYNDLLNIAQYWKKSWFLGAKKSYIDIYSNDVRTTVNGVKRLVVEQQQPAFNLRIQVVANYNFDNPVLNLGPGLQLDIKSLSLTGAYYYKQDTRSFIPVLGAHYDLFHF